MRKRSVEKDFHLLCSEVWNRSSRKDFLLSIPAFQENCDRKYPLLTNTPRYRLVDIDRNRCRTMQETQPSGRSKFAMGSKIKKSPCMGTTQKE
jgi:hypothetical protein